MLTCREVNDLSPGDNTWLKWKDLLLRVRPEMRLFGPEWFWVWSQTLGSVDRWTGKLRLLVVSDDGGVVRGIKVIAEKSYAVARLQCCAGYWIPQRAILADRHYESEVGQAIGEFIAHSGWWLWQLAGYYSSSPAERACLQTLNSRGIRNVKRNSWETAILHAPATWDEYKSRILVGKYHRKMGYYERKLARSGRVEIDHVRQPQPDRTEKLVAEFSQIESESWVGRSNGGNPQFSTPVLRQFWTRLIDEAVVPFHRFDAWIMRLDQRPVSFLITMTYLPVCYLSVCRYSESVDRFRTGSTIRRLMFESGIREGVRTFDFGPGDLYSKTPWGAQVADTFESYLIAPHRLSASLLQFAAYAQDWMNARRYK